jgi:hypothetical protein
MADNTALFETPEPLTDADNVGPSYVDYRTQAADDELIAKARARTQMLNTSEGAAAPAPKPKTLAEVGQPGFDPRFGATGGVNPEDFDAGPALAVAGDIAKGVTIELPQAVWYGLQKSAAALLSLPLEAMLEIDKWRFEHDLTFLSEENQRRMIEGGEAVIQAIKTAPDADTFLNVKRPETVTGNVVSSATQFLSVASRAAVAFKALGMGPKAAGAAGSFTSATTAFQGAEDTLAELIQSNPTYANVLTEFLASDTDDSEAEKRLKNGIEGLIGDALIGSFIRALKFVKAGRAAGMGKAQEGATPLPPQSELPELKPEHLQRLGDPNAPLVRVIDDAAAKGSAQAKPSANATGQKTKASAQVYDEGPFADGQLRPHSDIKAFVQAEVAPKPAGVPVINPAFALEGLSANAFDKLGKLAPAFGSLPNRFFVSGRALKKMEEAHPGITAKIDETLNEILSSPDFVLPNTKGDPWARPLLIKKLGKLTQVVLQPREDGRGIDIVGILAPVTRNKLNAAKAAAEELGLVVDDLAIIEPQANVGAAIAKTSPQRIPSMLAVDEAAVEGIKQQLRTSYEQVTAGGPGSKQPIILGQVTPEGVEQINALFAKEGINIDVTGYAHEVDAYAARHTVRRHGSAATEAVHGQMAVTAEDWARIPDVLANPDHMSYLGVTARDKEAIGIWKQVNGHALYIVETRTGAGTLAATSMQKFLGRVEDIVGRAENLRQDKAGAGGVNAGAPAHTQRPNHGPATPNIGNSRANINWAKIESADEIQSVLRDLTDAFPNDVPLAQRGVASKEATQAVADALGMGVDDVLKQRKGADFTPEQAQAASRLLTASQEKLIEVARVASQHGATAADRYAFRRMLATHYAIQAEMLGAGGKSASALDAWRLPAGTGQEQMRALEQRLLGSGGSEVTEALARRISVLALAGVDPKVMNRLIRRAASANSVDAVRQITVDGLLSTPLPHIANAAGGFFVAMQQIVERGVAGKIARATGSGGVAEGEATAMMYGLLAGQWDALRLASRTVMGKAAQPAAGQLGKLEGPRFDLEQAGGPGRVVDYLGKALGVGPKVLDGTDAYFKSIGYRMELHAQAFRQARSEGLEGAALGQRVAGIVADSPPNIRLAAADAALYNTFSNPNGAVGQTLLKMRNGGGALNPLPFVLPFVRAPINVTRYTFERTPLAPLVGQWRVDVAAGGARRDLALARMALGSTALAVATDLAMQGKVSGEGQQDPAERDRLMKTGWRPHAVNIGGTWHAYDRSDPLGQTLAFAAEVTDALNSGDVDPDHVAQWDEVTAGGIAALAQFAGSKSYLQGLADFAQAMSDPERFGGEYVDRLAGAFLSADAGAPLGNTPLAAMQAKVRALTGDLTPRRDLWGDAAGDETAAPIDQEMLRLGTVPPSIRKKTSFQNVPVNFRDWPEVYDEYVRLAGNALKSQLYDGLGARDLLDQVVSGSNRWSEIYAKGSDGPDGGKARFVQSIVRQYRAEAQNKIMNDPRFKDFAGYVRRTQ